MIKIVAFCLLIGMVNSCNKQNSDGGTKAFTTDKTEYSMTDSVRVILDNRLDTEVRVGLRCGQHLEMFYQEKTGDSWSDKRMFDYMMLKCLTKQAAIKPGDSYMYVLPAESFKSKGLYRLMIDLYIPASESTETITSTSFEIR